MSESLCVNKTVFVPVARNEVHDGVQYLFGFPNGYGASVVRHNYSYGGSRGLWELAVLNFKDEKNWDLTYDTEITDDVLGYLTEEEVFDILDRINALESVNLLETE